MHPLAPLGDQVSLEEFSENTPGAAQAWILRELFGDSNATVSRTRLLASNTLLVGFIALFGACFGSAFENYVKESSSGEPSTVGSSAKSTNAKSTNAPSQSTPSTTAPSPAMPPSTTTTPNTTTPTNSQPATPRAPSPDIPDASAGGDPRANTTGQSDGTYFGDCGKNPGDGAPSWGRRLLDLAYVGEGGPGAPSGGCTDTPTVLDGNFLYTVGRDVGGATMSVAVATSSEAAVFLAPATDALLGLLHDGIEFTGSARRNVLNGDFYAIYTERGTLVLMRETKWTQTTPKRAQPYTTVPPDAVEGWVRTMEAKGTWLWVRKLTRTSFAFATPSGRILKRWTSDGSEGSRMTDNAILAAAGL